MTTNEPRSTGQRPAPPPGPAALLLALLAAGCGKLEPCADLKVGDEIRVEVTGLEWGGEECAEEWGVTPGSEFGLRVRGFRGSYDCLAATGDVSGLPGTWTLEYGADVGTAFESHYLVERDGCSVEAGLQVDAVPCTACRTRLSPQFGCGRSWCAVGLFVNTEVVR